MNRKEFRKIVQKQIVDEGLLSGLKGLFDFGSGSVAKVGSSSYELAGNKIEFSGLKGITEKEFKEFDWKNSKLKWLLESKFYASTIEIDIKNQEVKDFVGSWFGGDFKGIKMSAPRSGYSKEYGIFGGRFMGNYYASFNKNFKIHPSQFYGERYDSTQGLFGWYDTKLGEQKESILLTQVKPGVGIKFTDIYDNIQVLRVDKRLDKVNSTFKLYDVIGKKEIKFSWEDIRGNFVKNCAISIGTRYNLLGKFVTKTIGKIEIIDAVEISKFEKQISQQSSQTTTQQQSQYEYILIDKVGNKQGPFGFEDIKSNIDDILLGKYSYVFREGLPQWENLKKITSTEQDMQDLKNLIDVAMINFIKNYSTTQYYLHDFVNQYGPYSFKQLLNSKMLKEIRAGKYKLIWNENMDDWENVENLKNSSFPDLVFLGNFLKIAPSPQKTSTTQPPKTKTTGTTGKKPGISSRLKP